LRSPKYASLRSGTPVRFSEAKDNQNTARHYNFDKGDFQPGSHYYGAVMENAVPGETKEEYEANKGNATLEFPIIATADRNIEADIFEFLGYVKKAKYVVTATFHGSIFSIIFKKQFVSTVGNCLKIVDILERLNLGDRDITNIEKIESVIDRLIDYDEVEKLKLKYRKESMEYLEKAILNGEKIWI